MKRKIKNFFTTCVNCKIKFVGSLEDRETFWCSSQCRTQFKDAISQKYLSTVAKDDRLSPLEKRVITYPFNCRFCNILVEGGGGSKAHRRGVCVKGCTGKKAKQVALKQIKKIRLNSIKEKQTEDKNIIGPVEFKFQKQSEVQIKRYGESFYTSAEWLKLRYLAFLKYGKRCQLCNSIDTVLHVDHVKPKSKHPELAYDINNLQILCEQCNLGKGNWDQTDWRPQC